MGSVDRVASPMRLDVDPDFLYADVADTSLASRVHRRCVGDASAMRHDPPTPPSSTKNQGISTKTRKSPGASGGLWGACGGPPRASGGLRRPPKTTENPRKPSKTSTPFWRPPGVHPGRPPGPRPGHGDEGLQGRPGAPPRAPPSSPTTSAPAAAPREVRAGRRGRAREGPDSPRGWALRRRVTRTYRNGGQRGGGYRCLPALLELSPSDPRPHTENEASSL